MLGLLLEEFPDVTISKIRFLESQGLIEPERTPSGYRKFFEDDVELLRVILREQREKFLPLRVIKDRIVSGEIETGDTPAARRRHGDARAADPSGGRQAPGGQPGGARVGQPEAPALPAEPRQTAASVVARRPPPARASW